MIYYKTEMRCDVWKYGYTYNMIDGCLYIINNKMFQCETIVRHPWESRPCPIVKDRQGWTWLQPQSWTSSAWNTWPSERSVTSMHQATSQWRCNFNQTLSNTIILQDLRTREWINYWFIWITYWLVWWMIWSGCCSPAAPPPIPHSIQHIELLLDCQSLPGSSNTL